MKNLIPKPWYKPQGSLPSSPLPLPPIPGVMMNAIMTTVQSDLGDVLITVTNCSTGNVWYDSFDSALEPQTMLPISGEPGVYEITYITESGNIYEGTFIIE